jgi:trans-aconitate 2-methyltransferase
MQWDPLQYAKFGSERSRPFFDLVGQVAAIDVRRVVDLGCGPGELTAALAARWREAKVVGLDSSPEMIAKAARHASDTLSFGLVAAEDFSAEGTDVLVSNALLQWVPGHLELLRRWAAELNSGGWLAFAVPANFSSPSHQLMREAAATSRWRGQLGEVLRHADAVASPEDYLELLASAGMRVNVWQTSYLHVLDGDDSVLEWVRGTGLRPVLNLLSAAERVEFETEYSARLRAAYPRHEYGTVFPFLRTFVVASKP